MKMHALRNDVLKINEIVLYVLYAYVMMYECEMLLKCIFVQENKSLTTAGEIWEAKFHTTVGDEEYVYLVL